MKTAIFNKLMQEDQRDESFSHVSVLLLFVFPGTHDKVLCRRSSDWLSLSSLVQTVYVPLMLYNESWQISVTKDFKEDLDKFLTTLNESIYEAKGQTLLYLPPLELTGNPAVLAKNKELTQRLESILIRWTRQIKEVDFLLLSLFT
jgi:hypothetical protein